MVLVVFSATVTASELAAFFSTLGDSASAAALSRSVHLTVEALHTLPALGMAEVVTADAAVADALAFPDAEVVDLEAGTKKVLVRAPGSDWQLVGHVSCAQRDALLPLLLTDAHVPPMAASPNSHALPPVWRWAAAAAVAAPPFPDAALYAAAPDAAPTVAVPPPALADQAAAAAAADGSAAPPLPWAGVRVRSTGSLGASAACDCTGNEENEEEEVDEEEQEDALGAMGAWELVKRAAKEAMARSARDPEGAAAAATVAACAYSLAMLSPPAEAAPAFSPANHSWQSAVRAASYSGPSRSSACGSAVPVCPCPRAAAAAAAASLARVAMSPRRVMEARAQRGASAGALSALSASSLARRSQQLLQDAQLAPLPVPATADKLVGCRSALIRRSVPLYSH